MAHVAAEMSISRATASKWVNRYKQFSKRCRRPVVDTAAPPDCDLFIGGHPRRVDAA
ncbi:hypothetical protein [Kribbella sp. NPDC051718]|uniref:hypothetical protein n=1 Tax=Kribbella sp. NPDC051718 TaxID=3155168 RepID=UPI003439A1CE